MMRRVVVAGLAVLLGGGGVRTGVCAGEADPATGKTIAVVAQEGIHDTILYRVAAFVEKHLHAETRLGERLQAEDPATGPAADDIRAALTPGDALLLALVSIRRPGSKRPYRYRLGDRMAVLDIQALKPTPLVGKEGYERYYRRLEKEAMHALGEVLGLPPCPTLTCAMYSHAGEADLDAKGRNFCPPCMRRAAGLLSDRGVHVKAPWLRPQPLSGRQSDQD